MIILTTGRRASLDLALAGPEKCISREDVNMTYLESDDPDVSRAWRFKMGTFSARVEFQGECIYGYE
jgi:hypothetical protein